MLLKKRAQRVLEHRDTKVQKFATDLSASEYASLHRLRITIKTLRNACQVVAPLFGKKITKAYLSRFAALQDFTGGLNRRCMLGTVRVADDVR